MKYITLLLIIFTVFVFSASHYLKQRYQAAQLAGHPTPIINPMVGSDTDSHGCIGSAGYSWCDAKQKCLRSWEVDCNSLAAIKSALIKTYKFPADIVVTITQENAKYASGQTILSDGSIDGLFLAAKVNDAWQIVYPGHGDIDCPKIKTNYRFPPDMLSGFCE